MLEQKSQKRSLTAALLAVSACIVVLDQATKLVALNALQPFASLKVAGFLNFTLIFNEGAAFGFLSDSGLRPNLVFTVASVVILAVLARVFWSLRTGHNQTSLAISFIIGGALGNLIDRIARGHVVDFIDLHYEGWHFYTFNVADAAITVGAIFLILDLFGLRLFIRR